MPRDEVGHEHARRINLQRESDAPLPSREQAGVAQVGPRSHPDPDGKTPLITREAAAHLAHHPPVRLEKEFVDEPFATRELASSLEFLPRRLALDRPDR